MAVDFAIIRSLVRPGRPRYPVLVHQAAALLHASFRPRLTATPLRFANPSPPSGWIEDLHLQATDHARHTNEGRLTASLSRARRSVIGAMGEGSPSSPKGLVKPCRRRCLESILAFISFDVADLKIGKVAADNPIRVKRSPTLRTKDCDPRAVVEFDEGAVRPAADVDAFWCLHVEPPFDVEMGAQGQ